MLGLMVLVATLAACAYWLGFFALALVGFWMNAPMWWLLVIFFVPLVPGALLVAFTNGRWEMPMLWDNVTMGLAIFLTLLSFWMGLGGIVSDLVPILP